MERRYACVLFDKNGNLVLEYRSKEPSRFELVLGTLEGILKILWYVDMTSETYHSSDYPMDDPEVIKEYYNKDPTLLRFYVMEFFRHFQSRLENDAIYNFTTEYGVQNLDHLTILINNFDRYKDRPEEFAIFTI